MKQTKAVMIVEYVEQIKRVVNNQGTLIMEMSRSIQAQATQLSILLRVLKDKGLVTQDEVMATAKVMKEEAEARLAELKKKADALMPPASPEFPPATPPVPVPTEPAATGA